MDVASNAAIEPHVINVPLDQIHDDGDDMRRTKINARSDAALTSSIKRRGVLQAIGVRPNGNGYRMVFGRRRLRCARAAGLAEIPADIRDWQDAEIRAVQGAENMQRQNVHPIDAWLTVRDLVDDGYTIAEAADELGLDGRQALQMERLGRLDDRLLKLCEIEMPDARELRIIANAPAKLQRQVASGSHHKLVVRGPGDREIVQWGAIAASCKVERISQRLAIFDAAAHPKLWEEDLFVPPDFPDAITTRDVAGFMKLQKAALEVRVETDRKAKKRVQFGEYEASKWPTIAVPKGWRIQSTVAPQNGWRPKKTESVFVALAPDGAVIEVLAVDVAAQKTSDRVKADRQKAAATPAQSQAEDEGGVDVDDPAAESGDREEPDQAAQEAITKAGLDLVAKAKTEALHEALSGLVGPSILLRLALMTFAASNVTLRPHGIDYEGVLARLVSPGGQPIDLDPTALAKLASDALTMILHVGGPGTYGMNASGDAAEWIGATIDAGAQLPRFDTEEFLKQVRGSVLVDLAEQAGIKSSGTVTALRARLVGQLPNWRPHAAQFGAPGPVCE